MYCFQFTFQISNWVVSLLLQKLMVKAHLPGRCLSRNSPLPRFFLPELNSSNFYNYYLFSFESFSHQHLLIVCHWSLSQSTSPQVSITLLSILANLNNAVVWMVSTLPVISKSSSLCTIPLVTVPRAPITIGIIVTFKFHSLF